jgi:hypothetical protein
VANIVGEKVDIELPGATVKEKFQPAIASLLSLFSRLVVRMTEIYQQYTVLTLDSDFTVYRKHGHEPLTLIFPARG